MESEDSMTDEDFYVVYSVMFLIATVVCIGVSVVLAKSTIDKWQTASLLCLTAFSVLHGSRK